MTLTAESQANRYTTYRHHFEVDELDAIQSCVNDHGFAIVRGVLNQEEVAELKESIRQTLNPNNDLKPAETRLNVTFVEVSPPLLRLLENERVMSVLRRMI